MKQKDILCAFLLLLLIYLLMKPNNVEGLNAEEKKKLFEYRHKSAILYINTNNGLTVLEDGTECESVANRLLLFDASKPHHSTTCTDQKRRVNINMNYM